MKKYNIEVYYTILFFYSYLVEIFKLFKYMTNSIHFIGHWCWHYKDTFYVRYKIRYLADVTTCYDMGFGLFLKRNTVPTFYNLI